MTQNKSFAELAMDSTRIPSDASAVTTTLSKSLKDGEVLADDGNSYSSVQTAENNASSWIKLPPSTFTEAVGVSTTGLSIVGSGNDTIVDGATSGDAIELNASDTSVRNLSVQTTAGQGNSFVGVNYPSGNSNIQIIDLRVVDSDRTGLEGQANDVLVDRCRVERSDLANVLMNGARQVTQNVICDTSPGASSIALSQDDQILTNSISADSGEEGIVIFNNDCVVTGCRIIGSGLSGIEVDGATDSLLADCRVSGSGGTDFVDNGTSTLVATDDSANSTIITDDTSGQQSS